MGSGASSAVHEATVDQLKAAYSDLSAEEQKKIVEAFAALDTKEASTTEAPKTEETPKEEAPKEEAPKEEAPKEEPPKEEAPKEEPPKEAAPKEEAPKEEAPKEEAPKEEAPKEEAPKEEAPKEESPKEEAPKDEMDAKLEAAFKAIDTNSSGFVEASELKVVLKDMGVDLSDEAVEKVFAAADINGDKKLDFQEYKTLVSKAMNK